MLVDDETSLLLLSLNVAPEKCSNLLADAEKGRHPTLRLLSNDLASVCNSG